MSVCDLGGGEEMLKKESSLISLNWAKLLKRYCPCLLLVYRAFLSQEQGGSQI